MSILFSVHWAHRCPGYQELSTRNNSMRQSSLQAQTPTAVWTALQFDPPRGVVPISSTPECVNLSRRTLGTQKLRIHSLQFIWASFNCLKIMCPSLFLWQIKTGTSKKEDKWLCCFSHCYFCSHSIIYMGVQTSNSSTTNFLTADSMWKTNSLQGQIAGHRVFVKNVCTGIVNLTFFLWLSHSKCYPNYFCILQFSLGWF